MNLKTVGIIQKDHREKQWKITKREKKEPSPHLGKPGCEVWTSFSKPK